MEKITINPFSSDSLDKAIKAVRDYKKKYEDNVVEYKNKIAEMCKELAEANIANCWYDDYVNVGENTYAFPRRSIDCYCYIEEKDGVVTLTGTGDFNWDGDTALVWVEFGAGMYHNGMQANPHEWSDTMPKGIGYYGEKHGRFPVWNAPHGLSRGTIAQMPMYNACIQTADEAEKLAKEIFK